MVIVHSAEHIASYVATACIPAACSLSTYLPNKVMNAHAKT